MKSEIKIENYIMSYTKNPDLAKKFRVKRRHMIQAYMRLMLTPGDAKMEELFKRKTAACYKALIQLNRKFYEDAGEQRKQYAYCRTHEERLQYLATFFREYNQYMLAHPHSI